MKEIQFADLKSQYTECKSEIDSGIQKVLDKGDYILGQACAIFEQEFADYCGTKFCVTCDNGTNAIELALRTLGIKEGDSVVVPNNTFIADALACSAIGAKIILCDVNEQTQLVDYASIKQHMNDSVKAVILVNLFGKLVDDNVFSLVRSYGKFIVEDCAQSVGASIDGVKRLRGDIGIYSFYPAKNLSCAGDGGALVTNNDTHFTTLLSKRNYGSKTKYYHDDIGMNSRLDTIQATILSAKLPHLDKWNRRRSEIAQLYIELLSDVGDVLTPEFDEGDVWHLFVIRTKYRDELQKYLKEQGINTQIHYPITIGKQKAYPDFNNQTFPITEKLSREILSLPIHAYMDEDQVDYVVDKIHDFFSNSSHKSKGWFQ